MAQQDYTGVNPIAALFSGIVGGGATQYLNMQEEERKSQFNAAKILLEAGINTGELKALTGLVDPKILKSWGLTPETIEPFHQMLEPRRQELASMRALREQQAGLAGAQARYVGTQEQIGAAGVAKTQAETAAIPEKISIEKGELGVKQQIAATGAEKLELEKKIAPIEAQARMIQARASEKGALSLDDRLKLQALENEGALARASIGKRTEEDRLFQDALRGAEQEFGRAQQSFLQANKPTDKDELVFNSKEEAAKAISGWNQPALRYNQMVDEIRKRNPDLANAFRKKPLWEAETQPGMFGGWVTKDKIRARMIESDVAAGATPMPGVAAPTVSSESQGVRERAKQIRKGQ